MTTKSINDRLGDGGFESVVIYSEDESNNVEGFLKPDGSLLRVPILIKQYYAPSQRDSNGTTDTTVVQVGTATVPGGTMNLNGEIVVTTDWKMTASATQKTLLVYWGGTNVSWADVTNATIVRAHYRTAIKNTDSLVNQNIFNNTSFGIAASDIALAIDTTNDVAIDFRCKWGANIASESITLLGYSIWYYPGSE